MPCVITLPSGAQIIPDTYTLAAHEMNAEATQFPVQDGAKITDHMIIAPRLLSVDMIFAPFSPDPQLLQPPEGLDRPLLALQALQAVLRDRLPCTVEIDGETYKPAVVLGLTRQHVYEDGLSYRLGVRIQEILIATAQVVPAASVAAEIRHKGARQDKGVRPAQVAAPGLQSVGQALQGYYSAASSLGAGGAFSVL